MTKYDLLDAGFHRDPAPMFARMRVDDPVYWCPVMNAWIITRHADVLRLVRDRSLSVDRGGAISRVSDDSVREELAWCSAFVLRWMVFADPPRHTPLRDLCRRAFTRTMLEGLRPFVERATTEALAAHRRSGCMEVLGDLANPVPALVTGELLGLPRAELDALGDWTADMFALFGAGLADGKTVRRAHRSLRACHAYFAQVIAEKRRSGGADLIAQIVTCPEAAAIEEDDLIGLCVTLVAGAYETTTHLVGNGLWQLLRHPAALARLRAEPALVPTAIEELFRFDGPALAVVRRAVADLTVGDTVISEGQNIYCMLYAANRDPDRYADPDRLDLDRTDVQHLGLGHGLHFCLGAALARLEAQVMLRALIQLENLALDRESLGADEPRYLPNLAIRGLERLPVRFGALRAN